jgi:hypothetical protein
MGGDGITLAAAHTMLSLAMVCARRGTQSRLITDIDVTSLRAPHRHWARGSEVKLMRKLRPLQALVCLSFPICSVVHAQAPQTTRDALYFPSPVSQAETDEYTRYELLSPETASFKIHYEVTAIRLTKIRRATI